VASSYALVLSGGCTSQKGNYFCKTRNSQLATRNSQLATRNSQLAT